MNASTVGDKLWIWGQDAGCYHQFKGWKLPGMSRMTPAEGAFYMGIPNIMVVRFNNQPKPPFHQYALPMRPLKRIVWSIVGDSSSKDNDSETDIEEVIKLADEFSNVTGAIMDDFFLKDPKKPARYEPEQIGNFQRQLHASRRPLDLYVVLYDHDLALPIEAHLNSADVITFWTWCAKNLVNLERNFACLEKMAPTKRKMLGLYMWDFGVGAPVPVDVMEHQCRTGLQWLKEGRIDGLIFLASGLADLDLETVEWSRNWIAEVRSHLL